MTANEIRWGLIGLCLGVAAGVSSPKCSAAEVEIEAGAMTTAGAAVRVAVPITVKPWLSVEAGILGAKGGAIADLTPMLRTTGRLFVEAGIGIGYNAINDPSQAQGAIFRDVVGVGYKVTQNVTLNLRAVHYSNGGSYNPLFGTTNNAGYTGAFLGAGFKF